MRWQVLILRWNSSTVCCDFIQNDHLIRHFTSGEFRSVLSHLLACLSSTRYIGFMHYGLSPCVEVSIVNKGSVWWLSPMRLQLSRHADAPHFSVVWHGVTMVWNLFSLSPLSSTLCNIVLLIRLFSWLQRCVSIGCIQSGDVKKRTDVGSKHCVSLISLPFSTSVRF